MPFLGTPCPGVPARNDPCIVPVVSSYDYQSSCVIAGCNDSTGDIVFALDASGSIEKENFERVVEFVGAVVHSLTIRSDQSPDGFQVALVSFADDVDIRFYLNTYTNKEVMLAAINIPYTRGRTNLDQALRYSRHLHCSLKT